MMQSVMDNGYVWDTLEDNPNDWKLFGNEDIFDLLPKLKKLDNTVKLYYQYTFKRHNTSCTKFSSINSLATNNNFDYSWDRINEVEDESIKRGFVIWEWWMRSQWVDTNRYVWNKWFPENQMASFQIWFFDDAFEKLRLLNWTFVISISVDRNFLLDINDNGIVEKWSYSKTIWHATCIWRNEERWMYEFLDSAFKPLRWFISKETIESMHKNWNIQRTCHVFIPKKVLTMITPDVESNQEYSDAVQFLIDNKITTAWPNKRFEPNRPITRAEMAMMLERFAKRFDLKPKE